MAQNEFWGVNKSEALKGGIAWSWVGYVLDFLMDQSADGRGSAYLARFTFWLMDL
jgi:hypothetical protein